MGCPLYNISSDGDPIDELLGYMKAKLKMSKQKPQESKLFATEILHGAPLTQNVLATSLKQTLDEKVAVIDKWIEEKIRICKRLSFILFNLGYDATLRRF